MELTELQRDALTELINIAFARTAASLSEMAARRRLSGAITHGAPPAFAAGSRCVRASERRST